MSDELVTNFLKAAGWNLAQQKPLAGDASARRYLRLRQESGATAILMRAPPAPDDSTTRFVSIARHLTENGIATPEIIAEQSELGLVLLEDLGDELLARIISEDPSREAVLYSAAVDQLVQLASVPVVASLPRQTADSLGDQIDLVADWYLAASLDTADPERVIEGKTALQVALRPLLEAVFAPPAQSIFVHRDYHAENLIWQDGDPDFIGLIDFQDAMAGAPGYDLISLLEDARRDLTADLRAPLIARYVDALHLNPQAFSRDLSVLGAQRNLRILGVFARLCLHMNKPHYVDLIPRVWTHLQTDLAHPALAELAQVVHTVLPPPSPEFLESLKSRCGTHPTP